MTQNLVGLIAPPRPGPLLLVRGRLLFFTSMYTVSRMRSSAKERVKPQSLPQVLYAGLPVESFSCQRLKQ